MEKGKGWVAAEFQDSSRTAPSLFLEAGAKVSDNWALYGNAWYLPLSEMAGGEVAARYGTKEEHLDLYAGGFIDWSGRVGGNPLYAIAAGARYEW